MASRTAAFAGAAASLCLFAATSLHAQERAPAREHIAPEVPRGHSIPLSLPDYPAAGQDETPIGPSLNALRIVAASGDKVLAAPLPPLDGAEVRLASEPFLGKTITPKLIGEIEAALARKYGETGAPVIARWVPQDDLSSGILTFQLSDFEVGEVTVHGGHAGQAAYLKSRLGLRPGKRMDSRRLAFDLDTVNLYPYRQVELSLKPGREGQRYDADLTVTEQKPWQAYVGYKYAGSDHHRTIRRYVFGGSVGNWLGRDSVLSFAATVSPDYLRGIRHPVIADGTLSYTKPAGPGMIEASLEQSGMHFHFAPFDYWVVDVIGTAGYRLPLTLPSGGHGASDIRFGIEAKHERVQTSAGGLLASNMGAETYDAYFGYHALHDATTRHTDFDVSLRLSPGGFDSGNSDAHYVVFSDSRMTTTRYAYIDFSVDHAVRLNKALAWHSFVTGQLSTGPVPYSDQWGIGGMGQVRGYTLHDGTYDDFAYARNEFGLSPKDEASLEPDRYIFIDAGIGHDAALHDTYSIASVGVGASFKVSKPGTLRVELVHTLLAGPDTPRGTEVLDANLLFKF